MSAATQTCEHCEGILLSNKAYRVRSEDNGLSMLDMIVCYACRLEAQNLGLQTEEIKTWPTARQKSW
jgi:RNase P subunit RPR2